MRQYPYIFTALLLSAANMDCFAQQVDNPKNNIPVNPVSVPPITNAYPGLNNFNGSEKENAIGTWIPDQPTTQESATIKHRQEMRYFDGLGRPFQTVLKKGHSEGHDIVQYNVYDQVGRESRAYLPYIKPVGASDGLRDNLPAVRLTAFYPLPEGQQPYSETVFDNSPLNRPVKQMAPGHSWVGSGRGVELDYLSNYNNASTGGINPVFHVAIGGYPRFSMVNDLPIYAGNYEEGMLNIRTVKDEDGNVTEEISDKKGRMLVKRSLIAQQYGAGVATTPFPDNYNYTFYVYDDLDRLRCVLPPGSVTVSKTISTSGSTNTYTYNWSINAAQIAELCYRYTYDILGRVIEKKIPGKSIEYFVYDNRDRPVLSQDGNLRQSGKWAFSFYDGLNRPTVTGLISLTDSRASLQTQATEPISFIPHDSWRFYALNYNNPGPIYGLYPPSLFGAEILSYNYYDNYNLLPGLFDVAKIPAVPANDASIVASTYSTSTKGMLTGVKVRILDPNNPSANQWITRVFYYDSKGRQIQSATNNLKGGVDYNSELYYFQGMPFQSVTHHHNPTAEAIPGASAALNHIKLDKKTRRNLGQGGNDQVWQLEQTINDGTPYNLAYYDYDHMGRVVLKQYTMANVLQEYNIRGWLSQIHARNPMNTDSTYFRENLYYDDGFASKLYSGNIAGITWDNYGVIQANNGKQNAYGYHYDKQGRLMHAEYRMKVGSWVNNYKDYTASNISYDERGNILTMNHRGNTSSGPVNMDQLSYQYTPNSNQLIKVSDNVAAGTTPQLPDFKDNANLAVEYTYDNNGNLLTDANKSITSISYNHMNRPSVITVQGKGSITYVYDAMGNRLRKTIIDNVAQTTEVWDYMGSFVYKNNVLQYILNEEGRSRPEVVTGGNQSGSTKFVYDYFIKDHLGNVRTTLAAEPKSYEYYAMHEFATANSEQLIFDNIAAVRDDKPGSINMDDLKAARLNAAEADRRIGTAIMLRVMPGDKFTLATDAYYEADIDGQEYDYSPAEDIVSSLLATLSGGTVGGKPIGETDNNEIIHHLFAKPETLTGLEALLDDANHIGTAPRAGLNYLFFDEQMNIQPISGSLSLSELNPDVFTNISVVAGPVTEPGYVLVYVDNRSIGKDVWFDNVQVLHFDTKVVEENHYYPFGLTISSTAASTTEQPYKYNGKELEKTFDLQTYEYGARQYNSQIGRWNGVDQLANKYYGISPFAYVANNPVKFIDPDGNRIALASRTEWNTQVQNVTAERDRLQGNINGLNTMASEKGWTAEKLSQEIGNMQERVTLLNRAITTFGNLETSNQVYRLNPGSATNLLNYDPTNGDIVINYRGTALFSHEATHAGQFESGDLAFNTANGSALAQDVFDEVSAYKVQWAVDPATVADFGSSNSITAPWVQGLTDAAGNRPYSPGGSANTGVAPVNINSVRDELIRAYPHIKAVLETLPADATIRDIVPTIHTR